MFKRKITILLTSVGVATGPNVIDSLNKNSEFNFNIVATDNDRLAAGLYLADKFYITPKIDNSVYIKRLLYICKIEKVDVLVPLLSKEILLISKNKDIFSRAGIRLAVPESDIVDLCNHKTKFVNYISRLGLCAPKTFRPQDIKKNNLPVFIKPINGSSSRDSKMISSWKEWKKIKNNLNKFSVQEFLSGPEYTVDVLCDLKGDLVGGVIRERLEVKDGKAVKCRTIRDNKLWGEIKKLLKVVKIIGPANIQCIKTENKYSFFEINTRFSAGGLPLSTHAGVNLPALLIKILFNHPISKHELLYRDNVYMSRYLTEVFPNIK